MPLNQSGVSYEKVKDYINDTISNDKFPDCLKTTSI